MLSTRTKVALASACYRGVMALRRFIGRDHHAEVTRGGVRWALDLREGIDFSVYLLGGFERRTQRVFRRFITGGDVALDVGANVGAHTLPLARLVGPQGTVVAFEPTAFAFRKLLRNISLNPELAPRVVPEQMMLIGNRGEEPAQALYASWPLTERDHVHRRLCGELKPTSGARAMTLDDYLAARTPGRVALIKLDVDGHECRVLHGGRRTLDRHRPVIVMELAPYLLSEAQSSLEELLALLRAAKYTIETLVTGRPWPLDARFIRTMVAEGSSVNVIARPL